jgi:hypothetical protein
MPIAGVFIDLNAIKYIANYSYAGKRSCPEIKPIGCVSATNYLLFEGCCRIF